MKKRVGRRGAILLTLAAIDFVYGWFFFDPKIHTLLEQAPIYRGLKDFMPLYLWAVAWWVAGLFCLVYAFKLKDAVGFAAAIVIKMAWAIGLFAAWLIWDATYAWAQAALWVSICSGVIITAGWPEPLPPHPPIEEDKKT